LILNENKIHPEIKNSNILSLKDFIKSQIKDFEKLTIPELLQKLNSIQEIIAWVHNFQSNPPITHFINENNFSNNSKHIDLAKKIQKIEKKKSSMKVIEEERTPQNEASSEFKSKMSGSKSSKKAGNSLTHQSRQTKIISIPSSSKKKKRKQRETVTPKRCHCNQSKCVRLHCVCFKNQVMCSSECGCTGCLNNSSNQKFIEKIHTETREINPHAFESRVMEVRVKGQIIRITRGCKCSKNNCNKNYCECKRFGVKCSTACDCKVCFNDKISIDPALARQLSKRKNRKKKKINLLSM
jgi:hypothetical protein